MKYQMGENWAESLNKFMRLHWIGVYFSFALKFCFLCVHGYLLSFKSMTSVFCHSSADMYSVIHMQLLSA